MMRKPGQRLTAKLKRRPSLAGPRVPGADSGRNRLAETSPVRSSRAYSLADLEVPVRKLLTAEEEVTLGTSVQRGLRRLRRHLPLSAAGYEIYLQHMLEVIVRDRVVVGWFHLRERMDKDLKKCTDHLVKARGLLNSGSGGRESRRRLQKGVKILRKYPLTPEMLYDWSRAALAESRAEDFMRGMECEAKIRRILARSVTDIERARDRLILPNFRLILKEAYRFNPAGMKRSDLFQEGILGLYRAIFRFDPLRKTRFSTYATYWIRQAIRKSLIDRSRLIRIPQAVQENLRDPDSKMKPEEARRVRRVMGGTISMSSGTDSEDDPRDRLEFEAQRQARSEHDESFYLDTIPDEVGRALGRLSGREREIVRRRFGLGGDRVQTLEEIGVALHLSRERIRQIEREALNKMRTQDELQSVYEDMG